MLGSREKIVRSIPIPVPIERASTVESPAPVRILTVCTGNICRSPVAERLLQAGLDQVLPGGFEVRSAGHACIGGRPRAAAVRGHHPHVRRNRGRIRRPAADGQDPAPGGPGPHHELDAPRRSPPARRVPAQAHLHHPRVRPHARRPPGTGGAGRGRRHSARRKPSRRPDQRQHQALAGSSRPGRHRCGTWRWLPEAADNDVVDPYRRSADYYRQMEDELAPAIISVLRFARLNVPS